MKAPLKKIKAGGVAAPSALVKQITEDIIPAKNQCELVLRVLSVGPITSFGLRDQFGIINPSARISKLKEQHIIDSVRVSVKHKGKWHYNVAMYALLKEVIQ